MEIGHFLFIEDQYAHRQTIAEACMEKGLVVWSFAGQELVRRDIKNLLQSEQNCALIIPKYDLAEWIISK